MPKPLVSRPARVLAILIATLLACGCLSSKANNQQALPASGPAIAPAAGAATTAAAASQPGATATLISQAQPGATGTLIAGVISLDGGAPPAGSTLYLGLVKSADDPDPRTCIDARRDPINEVGQFYAQTACTPQRGDMLLYVLVIGPEGERNWRRGIMPVPADLANVKISAVTS